MKLRIVKPVVFEILYDMDQDPVEVTFNTGETINAKITRATDYKIDLAINGGEAYSLDKTCFQVVD